MSQLSEAIRNVTEAAADLRASAAAMRQITEQVRDTYLPQMNAAMKGAENVEVVALATLKTTGDKAIAVLGHLGEVAEKLESTIVKVRDGAWVEAQDFSFGENGVPMQGRVRIATESEAGK